MAVPSEVKRVEAAIANHNVKELEWSLWYCKMRVSIPSARPADVKYWRAVEEKVQETLNPPQEQKQYAAKKRKKANRGLGMSPLNAEGEDADGEKLERLAESE